MKLIELKCHPEPFQQLWDGRKTFEVRKEDDKTFTENETILHLREYFPPPDSDHYSGREILALVPHLIRGPSWAVPEGMVVMSVIVLRRRYVGSDEAWWEPK